MPIYEYKCENGHVFDVMQAMADEPLSECTECGAPAARVLTAPAVHFKGSGFYNTDYGKRKRGNGSSEGDSAAAGSSESKGSESGSSGAGSSDSGSGSSESSSSGASKSESKSAAVAD